MVSKTANFTFGPIEILANRTLDHLDVELRDHNGGVVSSQTVSTTTATVTFDVGPGVGYTVLVKNKDAAGVSIGDEVSSPPFDVIENITVQIVTAVTVV